MEIRDYLRQFSEPIPKWLNDGNFTLGNFFESRTVIYPGAGSDGHAVATFNASRAAHCFVYVDYNYNHNGRFVAELTASEGYPEDLEDQHLPNWCRRWFRGYRPRNIRTIAPTEFESSDSNSPLWVDPRYNKLVAPLSLLVVYKRLSSYGDNHGAPRIAVLFIRAEANRLYETLYGRLFSDYPPFAVLLQDHGFGGNTRDLRFSSPHGKMATIARRHGYPKFLLTEKNAEIWPGYARVQCPPEIGGMYKNRRSLFEYVGEGIGSS